MNSKKLKGMVAALACLGALFFLWRQYSSPVVNFKASASSGEVLADEIGQLLGGPGKVIVISREISKSATDATGQRVSSFSAALKNRASLRLAGTEWTPRPQVGVMDLGAVSPEQFLTALDKYPEANVMVIFAGLPPWSPALGEKLTARTIKLVAVCGYGPNVRRWLESKTLALAVVPRFEDPPTGASPPKTAKDWFEREFQVITPATVGQLPY